MTQEQTLTLEQLRAQAAELDAQIAAAASEAEAEKQEALAQIKELVAKFQFKSTEVFPRKPREKKVATEADSTQEQKQGENQEEAPM